MAIRRVMSWSNALRCVVNGRAAAPPWISCSIGVSTSTKSKPSSVARTDRSTAARSRTMSRASCRTIRSAYRCRTRASSDRSLCRTGSGRSAFDAIRHSEAITDSSPRRDEMTRPFTNTWSPRSTSRFHSSSASSPTSASDSITWSRVPMPS